MKRMRNHTFPKTYTTPGAVYRAKKNFETMFPNQIFSVIKQGEKVYVLDTINQMVVVNDETVNIYHLKDTTKPVVVDEVDTDFDDDTDPTDKQIKSVSKNEIPVPVFCLHEEDDDDDGLYFDDEGF